MILGITAAWRYLSGRATGEDSVNTSSDQELLNRINSGAYRATPIAQPAFGAQPPVEGQVPRTQNQPPDPVANAAVAPDAADLRDRRLQHFQGQ